MRGPASAWSEEELSLLNSPLSTREIQEEIGRSLQAIRKKRLQVRKGIHKWKTMPSSKNPCEVGTRTLLAKTCPKCGWLLDARFFYRSNSRDGISKRYGSDCSWCVVENHRKRRKAGASDKRSKWIHRESDWDTSNSWKEWTNRDLETLSDPTKTLRSKARSLKRTYGAISNRASVEGFRSMREISMPEKSEGQWQIQFNQPEEK